MKLNVKCIVFIYLFAFAASAFDFNWLTDLKGENSGHTVCQFLTLPHSAITLATGQASSGGANDATDIPIFIANTALSDREKFSLTHLEWFMSLRKEYLGALFPVMDVGAIGLYSQVFTPGKIEHARTIDETISKPTFIEYSIGTTFARELIKSNLSIGCGISYLESHLDENIARGITGSIDLLFSPTKMLSAHLYGSNIGSSISYNYIAESLPLQAGLSMQIFPFTKAFSERSHISLQTGIGVRKIADQPIIAGLNADIKLWDIFSLRTGYEHSYGSDISAEGLGFGTSLQLGKYGVDGAWRHESNDLGSVWAASIKIQLEEMMQKTAEQYYSIALKHYQRNRNNLSEYYAKKALSIDPNLWKAYALINMLHSKELRESNLEIGIIYTGNIKGAFVEPLEISALGGLARLTSIIKSLQNKYKISFSIEAGNLITKGSDLSRIKTAGSFFDILNFDVLASGNEEINVDLQKLKSQLLRASFQKFLCANSLQSHSIVAHSQILEKGGYRFFVTSVVNELLVDSSSRWALESMHKTQLLPNNAEKYNLKILVLHDKWDNITKNATLFNGFDIVICGSIDHPFQTPMKIGSTLFLSAGKNGEYVGNLILRFNSERKLLSTENNLIPVSADIEPDTAVAKLVDKLSVNISVTDTGIGSSENNAIFYSDGDPHGVFPFISDRNGTEQIFLKAINQNAEFPLSSNLVNASNPVIAFSSSKIGFIIHTDTCSKLQVINLNRSDRKESAGNIDIRDIFISPDSKWFYFCGTPCGQKNSDLYRQKTGGGLSFALIKTDSINEKDVAFSPTEDQMVFCANGEGTYQLYLTDQTGEEPIKLTSVKADHFKPAFSPDGKKTAYLSDRSNFGGKLDIWIYDQHKKQHIQITSHSNVKEFCWLPDSRTIIYSSGVTKFELYKVEISYFRFSKLISSDTVKTFNERSPRIFYYRDLKKIVFTKEYNDGVKKIYWVNVDGSDEQRIINSKGNDWLPDYRK